MIKWNYENKFYKMIPPHGRIEIIDKIDNKEIFTEEKLQRCGNSITVWWVVGGKHHPNKEIPQNIYLLGNGSLKELHNKYKNKYNDISWRNFTDYTRELIKQGIMV